ncbi:MAG: hypothetical protein H6626_00655 [Pseudobdellovibrionaceae bacterium]|nr:hypothetical protein [Bdellovibrionales bacterium]USN47633.1 MAG: hypothetical protein H6626_00655 [Pseudobdellovibrionaceae bacterium]
MAVFCLSVSAGADMKGRAEEAFADLRVNFDLTPVDLDLADVLNLRGKYEYGVGKEDGVLQSFPRSDIWTLRTGLGPRFQISEGLSLGFGISQGTEVEFIRQFPSKKEALKQLPYTFKRLPISADIVRGHLNEGDFVSLGADLTLSASGGVAKSFGIATISASGHYVIRGQFKVQVYKKSNKQVMLRAFAEKRRTLGGGARIDLRPQIEIFSIGKANDLSEKYLKLTPVAFDISKYKGQLFMIEYNFNLDEEVGIEAYNKLMGTSRKNLRDYKIVVKDGDDLRDQMLSNLDDIQDILNAEKIRPEAERAVSKLTQAQSDFMGEVRTTKFKLHVGEWSRSKNFTSQQITFLDETDRPQNYIFATYLDSKEKGLDLGVIVLKLDRPTYADALLKLDDDKNVSELLHLGFSFERHEKTQTQREIEKFKSRLRSALTPELYEKIDFGAWKENRFFRSGGVDVSASLVLSGDALSFLESQVSSRESLKAVIEKHVDSIDRVRDLIGGRYVHPDPESAEPESAVVRFFVEINNITDSLYEAFSGKTVGGTGISNQDRWQAFVDLRKDPLFQQIGPGLLMRLLAEPSVGEVGLRGEDLERVISFRLNMRAEGEQVIDRTFGVERGAILGEQYERLRAVRNVLSTQSYSTRYLSK